MIIQQTTQFKLCTKDYTQVRAAVTVHKRSREELSHVRGKGQKPGGPHARGMVAKRSYPMSEVRGGSREEQPHVQEVVAAQAQEGLEELLHIQGQEGRL